MHQYPDQKEQQTEARRPLITGGSPLERAKIYIGIKEAAARLFPGHVVEKSCRSPFRSDRNPSFSVYADGRRWKDFGTEEGGDVVDFVAKALDESKSEAAKILIQWSREADGGGDRSATPNVSFQRTPVESQPKPELRTMGGDVLAIWTEGDDFLRRSPGVRKNIEAFRAWPPGLCETLVMDGLLSAPQLNGRRGLALPVQVPVLAPAGTVAIDVVGFHFRKQPRRDDERAIWIYLPNSKFGGASIPALPFVLGAGFIRQASTICVTEGEWDAVTLASQAGWLDSDTAWPEHVIVFGVRGASGWQQLIKWWGELWPATARLVIFRDADDAGAKWTAPGNFVDTLRQRGHVVRVVCSSNPEEKDLNDLHRANPLGKEDLLSLIQL
jgi:hypothetical protein